MKVFRPKEEGPSAHTLGWGLPGTRTEGRGRERPGGTSRHKGGRSLFPWLRCLSRWAGLFPYPCPEPKGRELKCEGRAGAR